MVPIEPNDRELTSVIQTVPPVPDPEIVRENFIYTIQDLFNLGSTVVIVDGADGTGKTTLLFQFAKSHPTRTLCIFASSSSRYQQDIDYLRLELCNQLHYALTGHELSGTEDIGERFLRTAVFSLQKRARQTGRPIYIVLDGLDELTHNAHIQKMLLDLLPIGLPGLCFLIAGNPEVLQPQLPSVPHRSLLLTGFSLDESIRFFQGTTVDRSTVEEFHRSCKGSPSRLASVRRIMSQCNDASERLEVMPETLKGLFTIEWEAAGPYNQTQELLLAVLAMERRLCTIDRLARYLSITEDEIVATISGLPFVEIDSDTNCPQFLSTAFKRFIAKQLEAYSETVLDLCISDLSSNPTSDEALVHLPTFLQEAGRLDDLLTYLSPEHISRLISVSQSLQAVSQTADLGLSSARKLQRDEDLVRFSVQRSTIAQLERAQSWRYEVEALIALDRTAQALALADATVLREDRLHLLAVMAKGQKRKGAEPDPVIVEQIRLLYPYINLSEMSSRAIQVAADLLYSTPDLAIDIVERLVDVAPASNSLDWAIARLSFTAMLSSAHDGEASGIHNDIQSRISDPVVRQFAAAASVLLREYDVTTVLSEVGRLEGTSYKIFLLRHWALRNRDRPDAHLAVEHAMDLAIGATDYSPNAQVFRELATPLPYVANVLERRQLVAIVDTQKDTVERFGPTEEYIRLQLLLARAEAGYDFEAARNRMTEAYLYICYLPDLSVKTASLSRFVSTLHRMDPECHLEASDALHSSAALELEGDIDRLLVGSADQLPTMRGVIRALARTHPALCLSYIRRLNTEPRRNSALLEFVEATLAVSLEGVDFDQLSVAFDEITDKLSRDRALANLVTRISAEADSTSVDSSVSLRYFGLISAITEHSMRCTVACSAYAFCLRQESVTHGAMAEHLLQCVSGAWQRLDRAWEKVDVAFTIASSLSECNRTVAEEYLNLGDQLRNDQVVDSGTTALTFMACLQLAIRAFAGLLEARCEGKEEIDQIRRLIDEIPSNAERIGLLGDLALRAVIANRLDICEHVASHYIRPLLEDLSENPGEYPAEGVIDCAVALYYCHRPTAFELFDRLSHFDRERCYDAIGEFILCRKSQEDPYEFVDGSPYRLKYNDVVDLCEISAKMDCDSRIYFYVRAIVDSVMHKSCRNTYSENQRADVARRLRNVITDRLPSARYIQHDGYRIAAEAQVLRMTRYRLVDWQPLIERAYSIPNIADRCLVLCIIANALPQKSTSKAQELFESAELLISQIPTALDRMGRYQSLAELCADKDMSRAKRAIREGLSDHQGPDSPDAADYRRRGVDLAYRLDRDLAASLASMADDDPARSSGKTVADRVKIQDLRRRIGSQEAERIPIASGADYARAAWLQLGSLNASRCLHTHFEHSRDWLQIAARLPLSQAYPLLAWVIQNAVRRYASTSEAVQFIRPLYSAMILSTELAGRVALRSSKRVESAKQAAFSRADLGKRVFEAGEREQALAFLVGWLRENLGESLDITDPYFGLEDLRLLQSVASVNPLCKVRILTSRRHQEQSKVAQPWDESYRNYWSLSIADQDPPSTEIVVAEMVPSGDSPIHDRWWITDGAGLRMGTSFNSLGVGKLAEVSILSSAEVEELRQRIEPFNRGRCKVYGGKKVRYVIFDLS